MTHTPTDVRTALAARLRPYIDSALRWQASEDGKGQNLLTFHETADLIVGRMIDAIPADAQEPWVSALTPDMIEHEAKKWFSTGLVDDSDKRAVTSFAKWLMKVADPAASALRTPSHGQPAPVAEGLEALLLLPVEAINALESHQRQIDRDGVEVGVSRQAVDEIVAAVKKVRAALSRPVEAGDAERRDKADYKIGWWLSGALEDPNVCAEMKTDINAWFEAHQPGLKMSSPPEADTKARGGPSEADRENYGCKPDGSCCDFCCGN